MNPSVELWLCAGPRISKATHASGIRNQRTSIILSPNYVRSIPDADREMLLIPAILATQATTGATKLSNIPNRLATTRA